jgi:farnesyl-diphosphate farnesyltransferase
MDRGAPKPTAVRIPARALLTTLLKDVSRSFYLTLRVLPRPIRPQIGLAYLLARSSDTIADTEIVPVERRLRALQDLRARILGEAQTPVHFGELIQRQGLPAERTLLERIEELLATLAQFNLDDQQRIRDVLAIITGGQQLDLSRFHRASASNLIALQNDAELDDYTYRVAGCVGEFWTKMCRSHLFPDAKLDDVLLLTNGVRFGKGLQFVNILRDLPRDLRQGRCYIPQDRLTAGELSPTDLLQSAAERKFRPLYDSYLDQAENHLAAGWVYTNALPRRSVRIRLACAWPILIAVKTISKLRQENMLDPAHRVKISRTEVRSLIARSIVSYPSPAAWEGLFSRWRQGDYPVASAVLFA